MSSVAEWIGLRLAALAETFGAVSLDLPLADGPRLADQSASQLAFVLAVALLALWVRL